MRSYAIVAPLLATTAFAVTHNVIVGFNKSIIFSPDTLTAAVGDQVEFSFIAGNHSVVSSSFSTPCAPAASDLIYSGYMPTHNPPSNFTITINSTTPIYYYCSQQRHCQSGMVGSINAPTTGETIDAFRTAAKAAAANVNPDVSPQGGVLALANSSDEGNSTSATATATGSASATGSATGTAATTSATKASGAERVGRVGGWVGGVLVVAAGLLL